MKGADWLTQIAGVRHMGSRRTRACLGWYAGVPAWLVVSLGTTSEDDGGDGLGGGIMIRVLE